MSNAYRIHGARFLRKYSAADRSSIYSYMADVRKIANTLCKVPWTRVKADIPATTTIHTEEGLDWNEPERDRFDAAEWCGEHSDGFHRAFAQAACYVFKLPASAIGTAIEKLRIQVTGDAYNPYGARIAAMTSATLEIPMDCQTVREGEVFRAPDVDGMGAAPRLFLRNKDGSQQWYANTELVELTPETPLTAKQYLFVFVCLENYNRGRDGWIEGSSYIDNDVEITLASACSDLVTDELNDLSAINKPTTLKLVNLENGAFDDTLNLSGEVFSMAELILGEGSEGKVVVITGDFDEYSIAGIPGLVVWDYDTRQIVSVAEATGQEIPEGLKGAFRSRRVKCVSVGLDVVDFVFDYVPKSYRGETRIGFVRSSSGAIRAFCNSGTVDVTPSDVACEHFANQDSGDSIIIHNDRIFCMKGSDRVRIPIVGDVSSITGGGIYYGGFLVCGKNKIAGNESAVKYVGVDGSVYDFGIDLTPDDFENFKIVNIASLSAGAAWSGAQSGGVVCEAGSNEVSFPNNKVPPGTSGIPHVGDDWSIKWEITPISDLSYKPEWDGKVVEYNGKSGYMKYLGITESMHNYEFYENVINGFSPILRVGQYGIGDHNYYLITGSFKYIGGLKCGGAALVDVYSKSLSNTKKEASISLIPLEIGTVKDMAIFTASASRLPSGISHALVSFRD